MNAPRMSAAPAAAQQELAITVVDTPPKWMTKRSVDAIGSMLKAALTASGISGNVKITYLMVADIRMIKSRPACTMTLRPQISDLATTIGAIVIGVTSPEACAVIISLPRESKPLLIEYFRKLEDGAYQFYPEPKVLTTTEEATPAMSAEIAPQSVLVADAQKPSLMDKDSLTLFLIGIQEENADGIVAKSRAVVIMSHLFSGNGSFEEGLVDEAIALGYLEEVPSRILLVEITGKGKELILESQKVPERVVETLLAQAAPAAQVSESALRFDTLKAKAAEIKSQLQEAERRNAEAEKALIPLKQQAATIKAEMTEHERHALSHDRSAEKHIRQAQECRALHASTRSQLIAVETQIRENGEALSTSVTRLQKELEETRREQQALLEA